MQHPKLSSQQITVIKFLHLSDKWKGFQKNFKGGGENLYHLLSFKSYNLHNEAFGNGRNHKVVIIHTNE
jgi:hypothetical protein